MSSLQEEMGRVTPLAKKKHWAAKTRVSKQVEAFYEKSFPGKMCAPDVFWEFIEGNMRLLNQQLQDAGENQSRIDAACRRFVDLFRKACVRARKLIDDKQTGNDGSEGSPGSREQPAGKALEAPKRPEDYCLW